VVSDYRRQKGDWNLNLEEKFLIAEENRTSMEGEEKAENVKLNCVVSECPNVNSSHINA
jgi:hypothetical protein